MINSNLTILPEDESTQVTPEVAAPAGLQTKVGGTTTRVSIGVVDKVEEKVAVTVTAGDLMPPNIGLLSTARNPATGGPPARMNDNSVLTTSEGMEVTVRTAIALGLVVKDAHGNYSEVDGASLTDKETPVDDAVVAFPDVVEAETSAFAQSIPMPIQDAVIAQAIAGGLEAIDMRHAGASGQSPDAFRAGIQKTMDAFQSQADAVVSKLGAEPAEFYQWAVTNQKDALQSAMREHVYGRNPKAYSALVERYIRTTPPTTEALEKGGIRVHKDGATGNELVTVHGMQMTARVAARNGWL